MVERGSIDQLLNQIVRFRDERNWKQFHTSRNLATSVSIEAAELLEIFQWQQDGFVASEAEIQQAKDEVADIFLYLLLFCEGLGIDIVAAASEKLDRNKLRFPVDKSYGIAKSK